MQIWPAIDLRGGNCVRLEQGDYNRETVYGSDPAQVAAKFVEQGARFLHLVDLDAAKSGLAVNLEPVRLAAAAFHQQAPGGVVELGGGIRDDASLDHALDLGIDRVVVGTAALREPEWFRRACHRWPAQIVLGIDARNGNVATDGWLKTTKSSAIELAQQFADLPLASIVYTDIATDGMLAGPNIEAMREMSEAVGIPVIASGGVTTLSDVSRLAAVGVHGCIIGRALYEQRIHLVDAIRAGNEAQTALPSIPEKENPNT
jgi:phosphoribosylformimino-5-aminoimidazole carboxamide ribotide isomerase